MIGRRQIQCLYYLTSGRGAYCRNLTRRHISVPSCIYRSPCVMSSAGAAGIPVDPKGHFVRPPSVFQDIISPGSDKFKPEADRYVLYICWACPWAHRCAIVRHLKGLKVLILVNFCVPSALSTEFSFVFCRDLFLREKFGFSSHIFLLILAIVLRDQYTTIMKMYLCAVCRMFSR